MKVIEFMPKTIRQIPAQYPLLIIITMIQIVMILKMGPFHSVDSNTFNNWSDALIAHRFNLYEYFNATENWLAGANKLYMNHIILLSLIRFGFGENWTIALLAINVICQTSTAYLLSKTVKLATGSQFLCILTLGIYCLALDAFVWSRYLLADSVFLFLNYFVFHYTVKVFAISGHKTPRNLAVLWIACFLTAFYRPHGLIALMFVIVVSLCHGVVKKYSAKKILIALSLILLATFLSHAFIMQNYQAWKDIPLYDWIDFNAKFYRMGVVVHNRPETYLPEPASYLSFLGITLVRFINFFHFFPSGWSIPHRFLAAIFFIPVYFAMALSMFAVVRNRLKKGRAVICVFALSFVMGIAGLSAISILDYDWRYRLSVFPMFVLIAVLGYPWSKLGKNNSYEPSGANE